ncbi:unnamed protein product [Protopolystoma xenopodis]|uniref:Uncharacterized protein n=1 Tax=Protopolystoma xenopodis TaxID=117903 RepID=A0A448WIW8_9PLAT|nr:unnamed protein product [Protopolystoma xenopodis]
MFFLKVQNLDEIRQFYVLEDGVARPIGDACSPLNAKDATLSTAAGEPSTLNGKSSSLNCPAKCEIKQTDLGSRLAETPSHLGMPISGANTTKAYLAAGMGRPNPYRNIPPPIDGKQRPPTNRSCPEPNTGQVRYRRDVLMP